MPKAKTNKGVVKRVRVSKKGKVKYRHPFTSHLMSGMDTGRKRKLRRRAVASKSDNKKLLTMLAGARP